MTKILFLCSKNKLRSPTAESVFANVEGWEVYSAGISNDAEIYVGLDDIQWADYIFVMENAHKKKLSNRFGGALNKQAVVSLDIPDDYKYMDAELVKVLKDKVPNLVR